jgi:hypothetical protein
MGLRFRDYLLECLRATSAWQSYRLGDAMLGLLAFFGVGLSLLGLSITKETFPTWVSFAWPVAFVIGMILVVGPFRIWREQKQRLDKLAQAELRQAALDEIAELRADPERS